MQPTKKIKKQKCIDKAITSMHLDLDTLEKIKAITIHRGYGSWSATVRVMVKKYAKQELSD